jgi:outer membrane protein assembly factor BamB
VVVTLGGTKQVITLSQERIVGVSAASGQLLWSAPLRTPYSQNVVDPVIYGDTIIYTGIDNPVIAIRPVLANGTWQANKVWENATAAMYMSNPVLAGDTLYGMSNRNRGQFVALDARTGKTLWATPGRDGENAAIVRAGKLLFLLKNDAELVIARPNPASFEVVRRYTVAESPTWAMPIVDGNRIFVKDADTLTLLTVS